ncbi:hypothetical protein AWB82_03939 [Caballeronia glebae]|uniref:Uncharacterized protein n=1 Tax=Caballeronia glebae TaxID=1777143 RepID=A0A158BDJ8_9BURK|nr:hypothetical protein AWB82_03939 [Caballeronia glebae]
MKTPRRGFIASCALATGAQFPMPHVGPINGDAPNAFAT